MLGSCLPYLTSESDHFLPAASQCYWKHSYDFRHPCHVHESMVDNSLLLLTTVITTCHAGAQQTPITPHHTPQRYPRADILQHLHSPPQHNDTLDCHTTQDNPNNRLELLPKEPGRWQRTKQDKRRILLFAVKRMGHFAFAVA